MTVPSNLIPVRVLRLPEAPVASPDFQLVGSLNGTTYRVRAGDLLDVNGVPTTRQVLAGTGLTGGGTLATDVTLSIAPLGVDSTLMSLTGVAPGTYGSSAQVPLINVDAAGRIQSITLVGISGTAGGTVTNVSLSLSDGITGSVTDPTFNAVINLSLGDITPNSVVTGTISGTDITASGTISGTDITASGTIDGTDITASGTVAGLTGSFSGTLSADIATIATSATVAGSPVVTEATGDLRYQPLDADLTSWAAVTRAAGFDTFAAVPSSANLAALVTDETGSGALVFGTNPSISGGTLTGGSINNAPIGAVTPSTGAFTTLSASVSATVAGSPVITESSGDTRYVNVTGDTMTGDLVLSHANASITIGDSGATGFGILSLNGASGSTAQVALRTGSSSRWTIRKNTTAESGADAGSNFELRAFDDAGTLIDNPISIVRASGGAITTTRVIQAPDGTVAAPSYAFTNDPDCGLYRIAANEVGLSTAGTLKVAVSSDIDITNITQLHMQAVGNTAGVLLETANNASGAPGISVRGRRSDGNTTAAFAGNIYVEGYRTDSLVPTNKNLGGLYFGGNHTDGSEANIAYAASIAASADGAFNSAADMPTRISFFTGIAGVAKGSPVGTETLRIGSNGQLRAGDGTQSLPTWSFLNDPDSGMYRVAANHIALSTGGTAFLAADGNSITTGNLGDNSFALISGIRPYLGVNQSATGIAQSWRHTAANAGGPNIFLLKSRGTLGAETAALSGDSLGTLHFSGHDGTDWDSAQSSGEIEVVATATFTADSRPGRMTFRTNDGTASASPTARMTIGADGTVMVSAGTTAYTSDDGAYTPRLQVHSNGSASTTQTGILSANFQSAGGQPGKITLARGYNNALGTFTAAISGINTGEVSFEASDGTDFSCGAKIRAITTATATAGDAPMDLVFQTKADGVAISEKLRLTGDGRLYGSALHNNSGAVTGTTEQYLASGTYTPTITNGTNVAASTSALSQWIRVGNVVTVSGRVSIDPTAAAAVTTFALSLPIASNFTISSNGGGTANGTPATASESYSGIADAANDRMSFTGFANNAANHDVSFTFTYVVL